MSTTESSLSSSSESSLSSVVSFPDSLHSKFWGTNMQEEEEAWRAKERLSPAPCQCDNNRKPNENPGNGTDESEDEDEDTVLPGCYVLDINNDGIDLKSIWVRAEYIRIYDYLVEHYNEQINHGGRAPSAVITGQPGIGKSTWLYYALRRSLSERRPTIFRYRNEPYIFVEDGVFYMRDRFQLAQYKSVVWALVDADESPNGVPEEFVGRNTSFYVIFPTSLATENWSRIETTSTSNVVIIMEPWSRGEIHRAAKLYSNTLDSKLINDVFDRFGPTPRLCIDKASDPSALAAHERDIRIAIGELTLQTPQELIYKLRKLKTDGDVSSGPSVTITDYIRSRITIRMRNLGSLQQVELYTFAQTPSPRGAAGLMFEAFFRQHFQRRILIDVVPMIRLTGHDGQRNRQWHTSHHPVKDQHWKFTPERFVPNRYAGHLPFGRPSHRLIHLPWRIRVYFPIFTSDKPKINSKFISRFTQYVNFPPWSKWRLIFIIPDDVEVLTCPHSRSPELQTVNVEDYMKVAQEMEGEPPHKKQNAPTEV
ncbi:hypothetical protein BGY98DRAFT_964997 [Russula aff. rugulosa BPL654]|nr:hypothetical protein BGY98DRAFT_964997 [Russula aff. rugulosa BPL654]